MSLSEASPMLPFLQKLEARSSLSDEERQAILDLPFTPQHVGANCDFVRKGEQIRHSSFVLHGVIGAFDQNRDGNRQIVAIYISGDMVDLHSVALPEAMSALQTLSPATILKVPHSALIGIGRAYPKIAEAFWRECAADTGILREWVVNVGRRDARSRMAHFFCELACRWERMTPVNGTRLPYGITQQQLSEILSMTPVHVNRTLQRLRRDRLLDTLERSIMRILDWKTLASIGDFNSAYLRMGLGKRGGEAPYWRDPEPEFAVAV